jgi:signal transduction histidine kinase
MFLENQVYVFPMYGTFEREREPLGLVVVGMGCHHARPVDQVVSATVVFLDLVSDIWAYRIKQRFLRGWLGALPAFRHGASVKEGWDYLAFILRDLLSTIKERRPISLHAEDNKLSERLRAVDDELRLFEDRIEQIVHAQATVDPGPESRIADLSAFLNDLAEKWERRFPQLHVRRNWNSSETVELSCDPAVLKGSLECLVDNALSASIESSDEALELQIDVTQERVPTTDWSQVVTITVADSGPGISAQLVPYVFVEGFSSHSSVDRDKLDAKPKHRGRGLSIARAQLLMYHGDLQLVDPGPRRDPLDPNRTIGATFAIRFAVPRHSGNSTRKDAYETTDCRRRP